MSKWINKELFGKFKEKKKEENESGGFQRRSEVVWKTPERGTVSNPKTYELRFLQDPKGEFYKEYFYHMFRVGESWFFTLCPKTYNMSNFCPTCSATLKLYTGNAADKSQASGLKRKAKYVANAFIVKDPRDSEIDVEEEKSSGKVKIYEFPDKVQKKLRSEIIDENEGYGVRIFDPSEEGYNFILKVGSTKKDPNGKEWPDYDASSFSRKASPIGTESEIEAIMNSRFDLNTYIQGMERKKEDVANALKTMGVYMLIEDEWKKEEKKGKEIEDEILKFDSSDNEAPFDVDEKKSPEADISDEDLIKELENL